MRRHVAALYAMLGARTRCGKDRVARRETRRAEDDALANAWATGSARSQRLVFEDPTLERAPAARSSARCIAEIEDALADFVAQRTSKTRSSAASTKRWRSGTTITCASSRSKRCAKAAAPRRRRRRPSSKSCARSRRAAWPLPRSAIAPEDARRDRRPRSRGQALLAKITRRIRSTSSCTVRPASARRPSRGWRWKSRSASRTRRSLRTRRSSKPTVRRCAGIRAKRRTRCSAACTIRSIKAAAANSPRAAFPNRSSAW